MRVTNQDLLEAGKNCNLSAEQVDKLWNELQNKKNQHGTLGLTVSYYFGGLLIIAAMTYLVIDSWTKLSSLALVTIGLGYALVFFLIGDYLWRKTRFKIAGGLLVTVAVTITPIWMYGLMHCFGFWPEQNVVMQGNGPKFLFRSNDFHTWHWLILDMSTIIVGICTLFRVQFAFITAPIYLFAWFMTMDLAYRSRVPHDVAMNISILCGLAILLISFLHDRRTKQDYAFWGYLFGMLAFWGGLTLKYSDNEIARALYCLTNIGLIVLYVFLQRNVFVIFGMLGVLAYLWHLADKIFPDTLPFTIVISVIGVTIIALTVLYHKNQTRITAYCIRYIPKGLRAMLPMNRKYGKTL